MATLARAPEAPTAIPETGVRPLRSAALMLASDLVALVVAGFSGMQIWMFVNAGVPPLYMKLWPAIFLFLIVFAAEGLYPGVGIGPVESLRKLVRGASIVYLILSASLFLTKGSDLQSRGEFFSSWFLSIIFLPLGRTIIHHFFAPRAWFGVPVAILGAGETAALVIEKLRNNPELALKPVACFDDDPRNPGDLDGVPVLGPISLARRMVKEAHVRYAMLAVPSSEPGYVHRLIEECSDVFPHVLFVPNIIGLDSIPVLPVEIGGILALELRHNLLLAWNRYLKRCLDLVLVIFVAIFAVPLIVIAALCIMAADPGIPFYRHLREGEGGRPLRIWKLRTMFPNAELLLVDYLSQNAAAQKEWDEHCKLKDDPRILPVVGAFLRRSSLDELPQLWNILIGEMSLVGPRPFPSYHMDRFDPEFRKLRARVRPGLTGLWQISARSEADIQTQAQLDAYYIRNWSLWLDIFILSRTAQAVIAGRGAY